MALCSQVAAVVVVWRFLMILSSSRRFFFDLKTENFEVPRKWRSIEDFCSVDFWWFITNVSGIYLSLCLLDWVYEVLYDEVQQERDWQKENQSEAEASPSLIIYLNIITNKKANSAQSRFSHARKPLQWRAPQPLRRPSIQKLSWGDVKNSSLSLSNYLHTHTHTHTSYYLPSPVKI